MRILTLNCNGIRAAARKGLFAWLRQLRCDVVCLQEVRAAEAILQQDEFTLKGYQCWHRVAEKKGYSGVSIYSRQPVVRVEEYTGNDVLDTEGRWLEATVGGLKISSLYMPSGSSSAAAQAKKERVLEWFKPVLQQWVSENTSRIICGDWNIAHTRKDIKNWRSNQNNSGFLPHEREWMSALFASGWRDVFRTLNDRDEQYTWWSNRGQAWANNTGWRIDYQVACGPVADRATAETIYRDQRFSDHAPLIIDYRL